MENILIPMIAKFKIEESIPAMGIACNAGDIFYYNPDNQIHLELYEGGFFTPINNKECNFICNCPILNLGQGVYKKNDLINIEYISDTQLNNLLMIGYIKKVLNKQKNRKEKTQTKKSVDNKSNKKVVAETYATIARKLNKNKDEFKKACLDVLGIEVKDMRKKCLLNQINKILKAFK